MKRNHIPVRILLMILAILLLLPILLTLLYSFFSPEELKSYLATRNRYYDGFMEIRIFPRSPSLTQYERLLWVDTEILHYFCNSALYAFAVVGGQLLILPALAFGLSCFRFRGRDGLAFLIVLLMVLPFQVTMVPNVLMLRSLGLLDTRWSIILPMLASPFMAFLLRQSMLSIPKELMEAAQIDGSGPLIGFVRVALPMSKPAIGTMIALSFAECWNMVEQPLIYLSNRPDLNPLSVVFGQLSGNITGIECAGAVLFILPSLFVFLYFQEDIMEGIHITDLK